MRKYSELYTLPIGVFLLWVFLRIAEAQGWFAYGIEILQKVILALVMMLIIIPVVRVLLYTTFPALFRNVNDDLDKSNKFNVLTENHRTWAGILIFVAYLLLFAILVAGI